MCRRQVQNAFGNDMDRRDAEFVEECGIGERARKRSRSTRGLDPGAGDREQVVAKADGRVAQCAFCGSDHAESFVTTSISRSSFATT